jgi:hypothetical protein
MSRRRSRRTTLTRPAPTGPPAPPHVEQAADGGSRRRLNGMRLAAFIGLIVICAAVGAVYLAGARSRDPHRARASDPQREVAPISELGEYEAVPHMVFRSTNYGDTYGKVSLVKLADPGGPRVVTDMTCDRVYMAASTGICLRIKQGIVTTYQGEIFDGDFKVRHSFGLPGLPSRARVSADGRYAAMTVFVSGDSYASSSFSTRTLFVETDSGRNLGNLEQFRVFQDGNEVTAVNRNYWGVTFDHADSDHFYATLGIGDSIHLIEGSVGGRTANVIADGIECPSLSPDGTRIAYKQRESGGLTVQWRLHVIDLESRVDHELAETRNVDDQVEWLDDERVVYGLPIANSGTISTDTWTVPADGSGRPERFTSRAWSPAAVAE